MSHNPTAVLIDVSGSQVGTAVNPFFISGSAPIVNVTNVISVGGGGADPNAAYIVLSVTGSLPNDRRMLAGNGLGSSDTGPGGSFTLSIDNSVVATVSGTTFTGPVKGAGGISGSLTKLVDGTSYIVAGAGVSVTSRSNGSILISQTVPFTSASHAGMRQLIHLAPDGPYESFGPNAVCDTGPPPFPTASIWYTDSSRTARIIDTYVTYNPNKTIGTILNRVYDVDGVTIVSSSLDSITYSGVFETSRTRTMT